jgi:hypothetical protein
LLEVFEQCSEGLPLPLNHRSGMSRETAREKRVVPLKGILKFAAGLNPEQRRIRALNLQFISPRVIHVPIAQTAAFFLQFEHKAIQRLPQLCGKTFETIVSQTFGGNAKNRGTAIARIHQLGQMCSRA